MEWTHVVAGLAVAVVLFLLAALLVYGACVAVGDDRLVRSVWLAQVLALAAAILPAIGHAEGAFPNRPVKFVVPFPAGTPPDTLARIASQRLGKSWAAPVIVEVRDGAGGMIGVNQVVKAPPDGYTLLFTPDFPIVIVPVVSKVPYDPRKDLAPIAAVARGVSVLVAHPSVGIGSIQELIVAARARPGALTFASAGDGSTSRMCMELLKQEAGIDVVQVPYRGAAPAIQAVLAGEVSQHPEAS